MKNSESGQGLVEYILIIALVSIVIITVRTETSRGIADVYGNIACMLSRHGGGICEVNARDDEIVALAGIPTEFNVAVNDETDTELDLESVTVTVDSGPDFGTLEHIELDRFRYTADADSDGLDSFKYAIASSSGVTDTAYVWIGVSNYAKAFDDFVLIKLNHPTPVNVLGNDFMGTEQDPVTIKTITGPESGALELDASGLAYSYTPANDFEGPVQFEYEVCSNGDHCDTAVARIDVVAATTSSSPLATNDPNSARPKGQAEPGSLEYMIEKVDRLKDPSIELELSLEELLSLMGKALVKTLKAPADYAEESGDLEFYAQLDSIISAAQNGNYDALPALLAELSTQTFSVPAEVGLKSVSKFVPHAVKACQELNGAQVSFQTFAEAREAMVLYGAYEEAVAMDEIWDINGSRNKFIDEVEPAFVTSAEAGIEVLRESGQNRYIRLAERMEDELAACSGN